MKKKANESDERKQLRVNTYNTKWGIVNYNIMVFSTFHINLNYIFSADCTSTHC